MQHPLRPALLLRLITASLLLVALAFAGCGGKKEKEAKASAKASAAQSGATATGSGLPAGAKPRVPHEMNAKDVCLSAPPPSAEESGLVTAEEITWPNGSVIKIGFLDGTPEQIETVVREASEWMKYANLRFEWYTDPSAPPKDPDELVTFNKCTDKSPAWYVRGPGPIAKRFAKKGEFTVCLSAFDPEMSAGQAGKEHAIASVKHEFGHVIGLMHEQFNPDLKVTWDKDYVYEWCQKTQNWGKEQCNAQVMATIDDIDPKAHWKASKFDKDSIMFYGIKDPNFTTERITYPQPLTISEIDKKSIAEIYPGADPSKAEPQKCKPDDPLCGQPSTPPPAVGDGGFKLGTASKKLGEEEGMTVWGVGVAIEAGDMEKVKAVYYAFPSEIAPDLIEGDASKPGYPVGGKVALKPSVTGFKVRARIDLKDGSQAVLEGQVKLEAPEEPSEKDLLKELLE